MQRTEFCSDPKQLAIPGECVIKPPKGAKRKYILVQNSSNNDVYLNRATHADIAHGEVIGPGQFYERTEQSRVPQETIYVSGSQAAAQQLNIDED